MREQTFERLRRGEIDVFSAVRILDEHSGHDGDSRKSGGVVYTPTDVAADMCRMLAPSIGETVLEPSCGRGVFVFAMIRRFVSMGHTPSEIRGWVEDRLHVSEVDPVAMEDFSSLLSIMVESIGGGPGARCRAILGDALFDGWMSGPHRFGCVIGNPPYVRIQNLPAAYRPRLRESFITCASGNVDIYHAFIEAAVSVSDRVCMIVPSGWMSTASGKPVRDLLRGRLTRLIDFGQRLVFAPVRAYSSIFLHDASASGEWLLFRDSLPSEPGKWRAAKWSSPRFQPGQWQTRGRPSPPSSRRLGDIADVFSGIATLCDDAFIGRVDSPSPNFVTMRDGTVIPHDPALFVPLLKPTKMDSGRGAANSGLAVICPYGDDGSILPEQAILSSPGVSSWLESKREALAGRDRGDTSSYDAWYAFGRRQGLQGLGAFAPDDTLFAIPAMAHGPLSPMAFSPRDLGGRFLFVSGFVVRPKPGVDPDDVLSALSSPTLWGEIRDRGRSWAGKREYRTFGARLLRDAPIP